MTFPPSHKKKKATAAKTFKCPERQPVTAYKPNPTGLTDSTTNMDGWIIQDTTEQVISRPDTRRRLPYHWRSEGGGTLNHYNQTAPACAGQQVMKS